MANIEVNQVKSRRDKKLFLKLPWQLYRDDPNWIPPLRTMQRELLNYKPHPFYKHAEIATFLAFQNGEPCGRVAAIDNRAHNQAHPNEQRGFVGFFECIDDQQVANQLLGAVRDWFAQRGQVNLRGPTNPSLNYECGMLI